MIYAVNEKYINKYAYFSKFFTHVQIKCEHVYFLTKRIASWKKHETYANMNVFLVFICAAEEWMRVMCAAGGPRSIKGCFLHGAATATHIL